MVSVWVRWEKRPGFWVARIGVDGGGRARHAGRLRDRRDLLPVIIPPVSLDELAVEVDKVTQEEEVVLGRHGHRVAHERAAVEGQGGGEGAGDTVCGSSLSVIGFFFHLRRMRHCCMFIHGRLRSGSVVGGRW